MYCGFRVMLALGKVEEVEGAIRAAAAADGAGVEGQLVLLEALLDLEGRRSEATRRTEARQTLDRLGNMQRSGVAFDAEQDRRLAALASRFEGPFGFFVRRG